MEESRTGSYRSKEREKNEETITHRTGKVISGEARRRKKSNLSKAGSVFMPGDVESVKNYILMDVLVPCIKRAISDIVCNGINMLLGEPPRSKSDGRAAKVNYRSYYEQQNERREYNRPRAQAAYSYDDIVFGSRGDAEEVLYRMEELLERFDMVSVADLFDMAGVTCSYTDNKYGWTNLEDAHVERANDGYVIRLPRATTL